MPALKAKIIAGNQSRVYSQDGFQDMGWLQAQDAVRSSRGRLSFEPFPPIGWEKEVPRYRATRDVHPSPNARHATENPHTYQSDHSQWQHGDRTVNAGEEVETKAWPHISFTPLNASAKHVLNILNGSTKSRLPASPWIGGQVLSRPHM